MSCPYRQGDATRELERVTALGYRLFVRHEVAFPTVALKGRNRLFCQPFPTGTCVLRKRGV